MLDILSDWVKMFLAVLFCAGAIKLADDYLDCEADEKRRYKNWAVRLGRGTMFYALISMLIASALHNAVSIGLFMGSYMVGMFQDLHNSFPSRLTGAQESVAAFILGGVLAGWTMMAFSLVFVLAVQLIDDCIDLRADELTGYRNLAYRFGVLESSLAAACCLILAWRLEQAVFEPVFCGVALFYIINYYYQEVCA